MDLSEINAYIHEHIPMTASMGANIESYDGRTVIVSAPIEPNLNHRNTAFGGSLSALGIVSGWVLLFLKLKECGIENRLVIRKSAFDFLEPIECDFKAACSLPAAEDWGNFMRTLKRRGRSRISLRSEISSSSGPGGSHEGVYVAIVLKETVKGPDS
jgi:thioesterase domain-containing protein